MIFNSADMENSITIGEVLRETRLKRGLDLPAVAEETKISPKNLQAMEDGNLASLPAEVYARGYYIMYARLLGLNPEEVVELYVEERRKIPKAMYSTPPPHRLALDVASMAERPTSLPSSYFGLITFLFLLFGAFLCWYFGWNPASYLSEKLRSLEGSQRFEQVQSERSAPEFIFDSFVPEPSTQKSLSLFSPATVTAAMTLPKEIPQDPATSAVQPGNFDNAMFVNRTPWPLQVDNQPQKTFFGKTGETISWQAWQKIIVKLPTNSQPRLTMSDIPFKIPKAGSSTTSHSVSEVILR